jgi:hypothetical protein
MAFPQNLAETRFSDLILCARCVPEVDLRVREIKLPWALTSQPFSSAALGRRMCEQADQTWCRAMERRLFLRFRALAGLFLRSRILRWPPELRLGNECLNLGSPHQSSTGNQDGGEAASPNEIRDSLL